MSDEERVRIAANIERAFRGCGYEPEMYGPFGWDSVAMRSPEERQAERERHREERGD